MAKQAGLKCQVFDRKEIEKTRDEAPHRGRPGQRARAAVHSHELHAQARRKKKLVFVGKGLTFDSGGLCIKPAGGMDEMKSDMGGAANVVGLMAAVAALKPDVEVHGIIASAENMPDGNAYRPGDVFGSLDGKTVGDHQHRRRGPPGPRRRARLRARARARLIVDNATLTGACVVALGKTCSGFYANTRRARRAVRRRGQGRRRANVAHAAARGSEGQLKSDSADLKHTGDRWGGSITAALFLREFVGKSAWIHADIAGPVDGRPSRRLLSQGRHRPRRADVPRASSSSSTDVDRPKSPRIEKRLARAMSRAIDDFQMISDGDRILVAVSGGKDSYTLHAPLGSTPEARARPLRAHRGQHRPGPSRLPGPPAHRVHGRRAATLSGWSHEDTYAIVTEKIPEGKTYCSLCSRLRRGISTASPRELGCTKIALGHHRDDVDRHADAQPVLLRAAQGDAAQARLRRRRNVVIRPLVYCAEDDIAPYAEAKQFPIFPCDLCGSQENLQRQVIVDRLLADLEQDTPGSARQHARRTHQRAAEPPARRGALEKAGPRGGARGRRRTSAGGRSAVEPVGVKGVGLVRPVENRLRRFTSKAAAHPRIPTQVWRHVGWHAWATLAGRLICSSLGSTLGA